MMNKFKMVLGCVALSLLPGGILAVVLSGPNDALFYGYFVVALPFLIMLYMGVGSLLLGILIFGVKLMGWSSSRLLKYPMRERNHSPHGFDFSDFLFAF